MTLDRRLSGVYVDIEDRSYAEETGAIGRSAYTVILSDRGQHNRIVELNSRQDLYDLYGRPNFMKYGQGHYLADMFLRRSNILYVCRPAMMEPLSDAVEDDCMSISNCYIKIQNAESHSISVDGSYTFFNNSNVILSDTTSLANVSVGDWVYSEEDGPEYARQIILIDNDEQEIVLDKIYQGGGGTDDLVKFEQFVVGSSENMRNYDVDILDPDILWYIYADGAGDYNQYFIKGVRNTEFEKIYTDDDGNALYPYTFMDIGIYKQNEDGTSSLVEGPWTVSLLHQTASGSIIKNIYTNQEMYLPTVINKRSRLLKAKESMGASQLLTKGVSYPYTPDDQKRLMVQSLLSDNYMIGVDSIGKGGISLQNGKVGNLFTENGLLNFASNDSYRALVAQAFDGSLTSIDDSVELILQNIYPWYVFDYVLCGGYDSMINYSAKTLVDTRGDCLLLTDTGQVSISADEDLEARQTSMNWNTWNAAIYVQYREINDSHTGKEFYITPVYHAIDRHLYCDNNYWISEPPAGIEKGAVEEEIELAYKPKLKKLGDLVENEMNPTIVEPDGTYILTQFTAWKRLSMMKRQHVVKFVQYVKKRIPSLLKDIIQRKSTSYWINQCSRRVNGFMNPFVDDGTSNKYASITYYNAQVVFDSARSEIFVVLSLEALRAIERITVTIAVT